MLRIMPQCEPVVASFAPDYSSPMSDTAAIPVFCVVNRAGQRLVLRGDAGARAELIVIAGFQGTPLPERMTRLELQPVGDAWRLTCAEGVFEFHAHAVDRIELRPDVYTPMHARFALSATDRVAVRLLLWLLRFGGGARVLRWWQGRQ